MSDKKHGRNKDSCKAYKAAGRREANKRRKMERHIKRFPNDAQAVNAMRSIESKRINAMIRGERV